MSGPTIGHNSTPPNETASRIVLTKPYSVEAGAWRPSHFYWMQAQRKRAAGKGFEPRRSGERRAVRPIPALPEKICHD
jgi:hypothetical protein